MRFPGESGVADGNVTLSARRRWERDGEGGRGLLRGVTGHAGTALWGGCVGQSAELSGKARLLCPGFHNSLQCTILGEPSIFTSLGAGGKRSLL